MSGGEKLLLGPAAAEGFDELHGQVEALAGELGVRALSDERFAAGVHHFEITDDAGAVAVGGQVGGPTRVGDRALLRGCLVNKMPNAGKAVLDLAECDQDLLTIARHRFFKGRL